MGQGALALIFITGCARSGTSLTTQILQALGCNLGLVNDLYENTDVREGILKAYLRDIGADTLGQDPLPTRGQLKPLKNLPARVARALHSPSEPWGYKDAKLALIWPAWAEEFPEAKWVIVRRDRAKIVASCDRTGFMRRLSSDEAWSVWVEHHEREFAAMLLELDAIEIWTDDYIEDAEAFRPVADFCGLHFDMDRIENCIDRTRWH